MNMRRVYLKFKVTSDKEQEVALYPSKYVGLAASAAALSKKSYGRVRFFWMTQALLRSSRIMSKCTLADNAGNHRGHNNVEVRKYVFV